MVRTGSALRLAIAFMLLAPVAGAQEQRAVDDVRVAARDLPRGYVLVEADIAVAETQGSGAARQGEIAGVPAAIPRAESVSTLPSAGWITRRVIREGEPLRAPAVVPPPLVARGDTVRVRWRISDIEIFRPGIAMGEATLGESIQVRVGALHRVQAVATGPSTVLVQ